MMSSSFPARNNSSASENFSKLEPPRFSQDHVTSPCRNRGLLAFRIFEPVEPNQRQGMAVLFRCESSQLAPSCLERCAKRNLARDVGDEEAFPRARPMFHAGGHLLPH